MPWEEILLLCKSLGYKSHDTNTAGLHIHVGRAELGNSKEAQEDVIGRILFFIEKHWDNMLLFSRRTEEQIHKWASRYGYMETPKDTLKNAKNSYGRYVCLNLLNPSTIEFRIFRGTLKFSTFIAALQLVDSICNAAIFMSDADFQSMTWNNFLKTIDSNKKDLVSNFHSKGLYTLGKTILEGGK